MKHHFYRLIPPRPDFPKDITPSELAVMQAHATYWRALVSEGKAVAAGPVSDPGGNFGIGILELPEGVDPLHLVEADPAISARAGFSFEVRPMMSALVRPYRG